VLVLIFTKPGVKEKFHKTWERSMFKTCVHELRKPKEMSQVRFSSYLNNNGSKRQEG
jgi:DNA-binding transcriptional regulator YiaG